MKKIAIITLLFVSCFSWGEGIFKLSPNSNDLAGDIEHCKLGGCEPIFGYSVENITLKGSEQKANMHIQFEFCHAELSLTVNKGNVNSKWKEHLVLTPSDNQTINVICNESSAAYKGYAVLNEEQELGIKIRKINGQYTHFGSLKVGLLLLGE